jgi:hypothetical protein
MKIKDNVFKAFMDIKKEEKDLLKLVEFTTTVPHNDIVAYVRYSNSNDLVHLSLGGSILYKEDLDRFITYLTALKDSEILASNVSAQQPAANRTSEYTYNF